MYFWDCEFAGPRLCSLSIRDKDGVLILNATIEYGLTLETMLAEFSGDGMYYDLARNSLQMHYGDNRGPRFPAERITPDRLADKLDELNMKDQHVVEWSTSFCDIDHIHRCLASVGREASAPERTKVFRGLVEMKNAYEMKGKVDMGLNAFFNLLCPEDEACNRHHVAEVDTYKLWKSCKVVWEQGLVYEEEDD